MLLGAENPGGNRLRQQLITIMDRFQDTRIVVLGDFLLDEFVFGEISRVSREAPVLILNYQQTRACPGGAANTVANLAALGATVIPLGVIGLDEPGEHLLSLWSDGVVKDYVRQDQIARTTRKSRILAGSFHSFQQQVVRVDYESLVPFDPAWEKAILRHFAELVGTVQAIVVSDYSLGNITPLIKRTVIAAAQERGLPIIIDSRDHPSAYQGATAVTPNITEVEAALDETVGQSLNRLEQIGFRALSTFGVDALLVTRGKLGMSLFWEKEVIHIPSFGSEEPVDVTGAGDTVAATFSAALASHASFRDAAFLANLAGGLVVMKKGTATVSYKELNGALREIRETGLGE